MSADRAGAAATDAPVVRNTELEGPANLAAVLRLCQAGRLQCSAKTSRPSAATVRAVADVLVAGDFYPDDAFAWPLLLAGGLARLDGSRLVLTPKGRRALGQPAAEVIRDIWQRWPRHAPIDELSRVEQIKGQKSAAVLSAAGPRREAATAAIRHGPPGEWTGIDGLLTTLRRHEHRLTIARSERALWKLYIVDPAYGSLGYDGYHDFRVLEGLCPPGRHPARCRRPRGSAGRRQTPRWASACSTRVLWPCISSASTTGSRASRGENQVSSSASCCGAQSPSTGTT